MKLSKKYRIAIVHDDFIQRGGAERLLVDVIKLVENSGDYEFTIYSSIISPNWKSFFESRGWDYKESFLRYFPFSYLYSKFFIFFNFFNIAFQSFNFDDYDVVFSSSTRFAHNLITKPTTFHISYINSPSRFIWFTNNFLKFKLFKNMLNNLKRSDLRSQNYSDLIISNSKNIQNKVRNIYRLKSIILYPFISNPRGNFTQKQNYFLLISRLSKWKRVDYVVKAFNSIGINLKIVGEGEMLRYLKSMANPNIEFLGYVSDEEKNKLLQGAQALIFPQEEDFGLTVLESLQAGTPIIYFNKGGAKEILNSDLGTPFNSQDALSLIDAVKVFQAKEFDRDNLRNESLRYSSDRFGKFLLKLIKSQVKMKNLQK
jgi:glycosyltransferase involved in cell wall biosynthesis